MESLVPWHRRGNLEVNPARDLRCHPEFHLLCDSHRYPGRNLQDYLLGYLPNYLEDNSPSSFPGCIPICVPDSVPCSA